MSTLTLKRKRGGRAYPANQRKQIAKLPRGCPIYGLFTLPAGRLFKVCAEPCMYAPGYIRSNKPRWPAGSPQERREE